MCHIHAKTTHVCCIARMWHKNSNFKKVSILLVHSVIIIECCTVCVYLPCSIYVGLQRSQNLTENHLNAKKSALPLRDFLLIYFNTVLHMMIKCISAYSRLHFSLDSVKDLVWSEFSQIENLKNFYHTYSNRFQNDKKVVSWQLAVSEISPKIWH